MKRETDSSERDEALPAKTGSAPPDDTVDRDEILKRRAVFIASAVAGLSLASCDTAPPQPCLSIEYVDPNRDASGASGATTGGESTDATSGATSGGATGGGATGGGATTGGANDPITPRTADAGAGPLPSRPDGGPPMPCLSPPPQPCLKVAPPPQPCLTPVNPKK